MIEVSQGVGLGLTGTAKSVAAQAATATIGTRYRTIEALNDAGLRTIRDLLSAGT